MYVYEQSDGYLTQNDKRRNIAISLIEAWGPSSDSLFPTARVERLHRYVLPAQALDLAFKMSGASITRFVTPAALPPAVREIMHDPPGLVQCVFASLTYEPDRDGWPIRHLEFILLSNQFAAHGIIGCTHRDTNSVSVHGTKILSECNACKATTIINNAR